MKIKVAKGIQISLEKDVTLKMLIYVVWASMLLAFLKGVILRIPILNDYSETALSTAIIIPVVIAIPALINQFCLGDYLFYFLNVFYLLANFVIFPENTLYLADNALRCIFCIFTYYFIGRLIDIDKLFNTLVILSTICIYLDLFYFLVYAPRFSNMADVAGEDNMWGAYQILPHVAMILWATLKKFRIWKVVTLLLGLLFLLSCGTRGPFVPLAFMGIIYFLFYMKFKGAVYVKIGIISAFLIVVFFLKDIILFLAQTFTGLQLSTRILEKFVSGEIGHDSYRGVLRDKLYAVMENGDHFWGLGIFGCRNYDILYPHYLPLDFICTYGYLIGYILLFLLFVFVAWAFWITRGTKSQEFVLYLFSISIIKLFLSNSFILEPYFFMLIGFCSKEILSWYFTNIKQQR